MVFIFENNSTVITTSEIGGNVIAASESEGTANAFSSSISGGNGSSRAEASVVEGHVLASGIPEIISNTEDNYSSTHAQNMLNSGISFDDPIIRPDFVDPFKKKENVLGALSSSTTKFDISPPTIDLDVFEPEHQITNGNHAFTKSTN